VAIRRSVNGVPEMNYIHTDYLGSVRCITNATGTIEEKLSYNAWGFRRDPFTGTVLTYDQLLSTAATRLTARGYTGHEHLDEFGLINMNGRVYDPALGIFISPDPYIQAPDNTQNYNRFSYCVNNPLMYTDPSGEIIPELIQFGVSFISNYISNGINTHNWGWKNIGNSALSAALSVADMHTFGLTSLTYNLGSAAINSNFNLSVMMNTLATSAINRGLNQKIGIKTGIDNWVLGGIVDGALTGAVVGGLASAVTGNNVWKGMKDGAIFGGIYGGVRGATYEGMAFLGAFGHSYHDDSNDARFGSDSYPVKKYSNGTITEDPDFPGVKIKCGNYSPHYRNGIIYIDASTSDQLSLVQHEYGHYLQFLNFGKNTFKYIAINSALNFAADRIGLANHAYYFLEVNANDFSRDFFKNTQLNTSPLGLYNSSSKAYPFKANCFTMYVYPIYPEVIFNFAIIKYLTR
jgi:RHS repeat-associated protein